MYDVDRWLGLDYGDKTIGVAVSDALGWTAQGVEGIPNTSKDAVFKRIETLSEQYNVTGYVVGLPKNMDGSIGERGKICMEFADELKCKLSKPVHLWDERLTTASAQRTLLEADVSRKKRKKVVDKMAAVLILQGFMDRKQNEERLESEQDV